MRPLCLANVATSLMQPILALKKGLVCLESSTCNSLPKTGPSNKITVSKLPYGN